MSSTGRAEDRQALDDYPTPRWCVHRLLEAKPDLPSGLWLEPCAGAGSIVLAVREKWPGIYWHINEINRERYTDPLLRVAHIDDSVSFWDARSIATFGARVVITNPPFGVSLEVLQHMLAQPQKPLVIFLQRLNWAAGPRRELFRSLRPSVYVLPDRPSFIDTPKASGKLEAQTDSIEYAWFIFDGSGTFAVLGDTPADVRKAEIEEGRANGTRPRRVRA